jgi:hypothetical protein
MAVVPRPQAAGANTTLKIALFAFVALTVVSLAGTIILYTYQSDLQARASEVEDQARRTDQQARDAQRQLEDFARIVIGEATDEVPKIRQAIAAAVQRVAEDANLQEANITQDSAMLTVLETLYSQFSDKVDMLNQANERVQELEDQRQSEEESMTANRQQFTDKVEQLQDDYQTIEQQSAENREAWDRQIDELSSQLESASESASNQLTNLREQHQLTKEKLAAAQQQRELLVAELASFRPQADLTSALRIADGHVVRTVPGEDIAYISLGRRDGLKTRMTFGVYSRTRGVPEDGKGKATIEVVNLFETTAECRVTSTTPGEPILENDIIANPVFDKSRKYNFLVAGDFDLDFDGQIEDPGGSQVSSLIEQTGGLIVKTLDTRTDFVVLGAAPPLPVQSRDTDTPEDQERAAQREARRKSFDTVVQEAKALSIPVLTRTQFLHFIGFGQIPKNAPDDQRPVL